MKKHVIGRGLLVFAGLSSLLFMAQPSVAQSTVTQHAVAQHTVAQPRVAQHTKPARAMDTIEITISGTAGTEYSAYWKIENAGKIQEINEEKGQLPANITYIGEAVTGKITLLNAGQLTVNIEKNGHRSRSSTQGKGSTLQMSVR